MVDHSICEYMVIPFPFALMRRTAGYSHSVICTSTRICVRSFHDYVLGTFSTTYQPLVNLHILETMCAGAERQQNRQACVENLLLTELTRTKKRCISSPQGLASLSFLHLCKLTNGRSVDTRALPLGISRDMIALSAPEHSGDATHSNKRGSHFTPLWRDARPP